VKPHTTLRHWVAAAAPLLVASAYGWFVLQRHLASPEGDHQIFFAVPLCVWTLAYFPSYLVLWRRGSAPRRAIFLSAAIATGFLAVAYGVLGAFALLSGVGRQMVG